MQFEQTNFRFQPRKNSSYIKKDNEGAKIFRKLLDTLSIKGFVSPIQAIEVITKFLLIKEIFVSGLLNKYKESSDSPAFQKFIDIDWESFKAQNRHQLIDIFKNDIFPLTNFLANQGEEIGLLASSLHFEISNLPNDFIFEVLYLIDLATEKNEYTARDLFEDLFLDISITGTNGQFKTPNHLIELMVEMVSPNSNDSILDPFCGTGTTLIQAAKYIYKNEKSLLSKEDKKIQFSRDIFWGNDLNSTISNLGKIRLFLNGIKPNITNQDTFNDEFLEENQDKFSLIISNPPFGIIRSERYSKVLELNTNKSHLLTIEASLKMLKEGGRAAIIVPQGLLFGSSKDHLETRKRLIEDNLLEGVVSLPNGVFNPYTGIQASILLFKKNTKNTTKKVWFYDIQADGFSLNHKRTPLLNEDITGPNPNKALTAEEHRKNNLPECLNQWKDKNLVSEQSFYVDVKTLKENNYDLSLAKYTENKFLQILVDKISTKPIKISEITKKIILGVYAKNIFEDISNAIYIPRIGKSKVLCSLNELKLKQQNYFQLVVDENKSKASFLAEFLNSEVGKYLLYRQHTGYIKNLTKTNLLSMDVYIPSLKIQEKLLTVDSKIEDKEKIILGFLNYLEERKKKLWKESNSIEIIEKEIDQFSLKFSEKSKEKSESSLSNWIETIPFPLASILRKWQITEKEDYKSRYQHLLKFFEASSIFLSSIYISAFEQDQNYEEHKITLRNHMKKHGLTFKRSSFGTWTNVIRYYGAKTRKLINKKYEYDEKINDHKILTNLFKVNSLNFPISISQLEILNILENAQALRNRDAHGGFISNEENETKYLNDKLVGMLEKFRNLTDDIWDNSSLVIGYKCNFSRGIYTNHIKILKGSNSEFLKESLQMSMPLDEQFMYLTHSDYQEALKLEPLIQISSSPRNVKNACYFYNSIYKNSAKFVSYHHSDNVIEGSEFKDTISIINSLSGD